MGKDTTAFRERFKAYKNGKSVSEIYDAGLPKYGDGKQGKKKSRFNESLGGKYLYVIDNTIDYLHSQGVDPMLIAGILGNMALESGFNPDSIGPGGFAGTVQMSSDMANEIKRAYGKVDYETTNRFIHDAMSGNKIISQPWRNYMKQHGGYYGRTFNSAGDAAMAFGRVFERPNEKYANWASRILSAEHALDYVNLRIGTPSELVPVTQTTAAEYNAAHQFQPWSNYHLPDYSLNNPAPAMISSMNNPGSPTFTTPELQSRRSYNNIKDVAFDIMNGKDVGDALMDNLSNNVFGGRKIGFKDGKLPGFHGGKGDGTKYLYDEQEDKWDRVTAGDVADAMSQFVVTPHGVRGKFDYENNTNPIKPLSKNAVVKSDDTLWTRLLVEKANNTRTWRSDVADQFHDLGEASLLMSNFVSPETEPLLYPAYQHAKQLIQQGAKEYIAPKVIPIMMRPLSKYISNVADRFRNQEWSNFLATKNADAYFRINTANKNFNNGEKYFLSHTTPWEEFSGLGSEHPHGGTMLYEFPTNTFGRLQSTTDIGVPTGYDVIDFGKKHLFYGNTSSGKRDVVKLLNDNAAKSAEKYGISSTKIGIVDRPLKQNGLYDANPEYENIRMGNQTAVRGRKINQALKNTEYKKYTKTYGGIQKEIYIPGKYNGINPDWKNPINNALSIEQQDAMLGEYVGRGAERLVFTDRRYPGRVIKIGGGLNGELNIQTFDLLRDAVEYTMEMNKLPGVEPISYEGFIDEHGQLIPWFSQLRLFPMNKIADPFYTFSKPMILPNGKPLTKGKLAAIRNTDYEKLLTPLGYKDSPNGFILQNYPYPIRDLGQKNIGFDINGNFKIFDPMIEL